MATRLRHRLRVDRETPSWAAASFSSKPSTRLQVIQERHEMFEASAEPVQPPADQHVEPAGLARAKRNGTRLGRPEKQVPERILAPVRGLSVREAARRLGVSPATAHRWLSQ